MLWYFASKHFRLFFAKRYKIISFCISWYSVSSISLQSAFIASFNRQCCQSCPYPWLLRKLPYFCWFVLRFLFRSFWHVSGHVVCKKKCKRGPFSSLLKMSFLAIHQLPRPTTGAFLVEVDECKSLQCFQSIVVFLECVCKICHRNIQFPDTNWEKEKIRRALQRRPS